MDLTENQEWLTPNAFAKVVNVSAQAVLNAIESGRFTSDALKNEETKSGKTRYKIAEKLGKIQWQANKKDNSRKLTDADTQDAKRREVVAKAELAELDLAERQGELVSVEVMQAYHSKIATTLVTDIDTTITRSAPQLLNIASPLEMEKLLRKIFMGYFDEFARGCEGKGPYSERIR